MLEVKEATESVKEEWDQFLISHESDFLQSWEWGEYQKSLERKIFRFVLRDGVFESPKNIVGAVLLIKQSLPFGFSYLYSPRGPVLEKLKIQSEKLKVYDLIINKIKGLARKEKVIFWRFEPSEIPILELKKNLSKTISIQPSQTLVLNLEISEEELLAEMHPKTRYNLRLAERKGIKIFRDESKIDEFADLLKKTAQRGNFRVYPVSYYKKLLSFFSQGKENRFSVKLFIADYQGKVIAAAIAIFFGCTATYLHGALDYRHRSLMAPYLLQWSMIREAKRRGYKYYDFWGINLATEDGKGGVTRFKKGFGGKELSYPGTFDLIFNTKWYNIYQMIRKFKRQIL